LAKENCFSIRGGSAENQFFHTENIPRSKREELCFHMIRVATGRLDEPPFPREDCPA
jgi:hypothetical protein